MAVNFRRLKARRRLASLAFLSTISFEGDCQESSFGAIAKHNGSENQRTIHDQGDDRSELIDSRRIQAQGRFNSGEL